MLVIELGMYGRGFALIARETEKATACVRDAERFMQELADEMNKKKSAHMAIMQLADSAFKMNVNAFNAAVEAARCGEPSCHKYAEGIRSYAGQLQYAYKTCEDLMKHCVKLMSLLRDEDKSDDSHLLQKQSDNTIFQAGLLNTQLSLESERSGRDEFRALSHEFEKALADFKHRSQQGEHTDKADTLKTYKEKLSVLIDQGNKTAKAAGDHGVGIAYILNEFRLFNSQQ